MGFHVRTGQGIFSRGDSLPAVSELRTACVSDCGGITVRSTVFPTMAACFTCVTTARSCFRIEFDLRPEYYRYSTSDGTQMKTVAAYGREGTINIAYSNECALKDKGEDCLFCNANATKDAYGEKENIFWKNPGRSARPWPRLMNWAPNTST